MNTEELQEYKQENPDEPMGVCYRCQIVEPEEFLTREGLCEVCDSDMHDE